MKFIVLAFLTFLALQVNAENYDKCPVELQKCNPTVCKPPDCACSGDEPDVALAQRPQIVYLTFDDGMTALFDKNFYTELFKEGRYNNPNGCPIRSTFYVTARSNDFSVTHDYWNLGHEIASHSITHRYNTTYWRIMTPTEWASEMGGMRDMTSYLANIPKKDIVGMRTPYLQSGGDEMYTMMQNEDFLYDCSAPSQSYGYLSMEDGRWPYTHDYINDMDCQIEPCPTCSFPGIWSQPMLDLEDNRGDQNPDGTGNGFPCAMADTCVIPEGQDPTVVRDMFKRNFERAYNGKTRAPFGLYLHTAWFVGQDWHFQGYKLFLEYLLALKDVWIVPVQAGIEYMKNGTLTNQDLIDGKFDPFNCNDYPIIPGGDCSKTSCSYEVDNADIHENYYMTLCKSDQLRGCPDSFPWLENPLGD